MLSRLISILFPAPRTAASVNVTRTGVYDFAIVGEASYQHNLESICARTRAGVEYYCDATLQFERGNLHDPNAVVVKISGVKVGYLSRADAIRLRKQASECGLNGCQFVCGAVIVGGWARPHDIGHFGVKLDARMPLDIAGSNSALCV